VNSEDGEFEFHRRRGGRRRLTPGDRHESRPPRPPPPGYATGTTDHIVRKPWKLHVIAQTVSTTPSHFVAQTQSINSEGNMRKFWEEYSLGGENSTVVHKSDNISETRKDRRKIIRGHMRTHQRSVELYHPRPPMASLPQDSGSHPNANFNRYYLTNG